jgi:hypothetical protein
MGKATTPRKKNDRRDNSSPNDSTGKGSSPLNKEDIPFNPDHKIDQDFPGHPYAQSDEKIINPSTSNEKETADINNKDGEKINYTIRKKSGEMQSDG